MLKIVEKYYHEICNIEFTGAHIREIKRTADLLSDKRNEKIENVMKDAIDIVKNNFCVSGLKMGFMK